MLGQLADLVQNIYDLGMIIKVDNNQDFLKILMLFVFLCSIILVAHNGVALEAPVFLSLNFRKLFLYILRCDLSLEQRTIKYNIFVKISCKVSFVLIGNGY